MSTATTLLFNVAVGFLAARCVAPPEAAGPPQPGERERDRPTGTPPAGGTTTTELDDFMMEKTK